MTGTVTQWDKVNLTMVEVASISFPCQPRVQRYPFGRYQCNVSLFLAFEWQAMIWKTNRGDLSTFYPLEYEGEHDLLDYYLENVTLNLHHPFVTLTLHLSGRYEYHLLNSFCPSALMFVISYSTLFFPINDINERFMGS